MNYFAQVNDIGDYYQINFITTNIQLSVGYEYLPLNNITSEKIETLLSNGYEILVLKGIKRELLPGDLIINKKNEIKSNKYIHKLNKLIDNHSVSLSFLDLFNFMKSQQVLNSYQYFINDDNRYKIYMDIAKTNNITLINALESYIVAESKCSVIVDRVNQINNAIDKIKNIDNEEQMRIICESQTKESNNENNVVDVLVSRLKSESLDYVKTIATEFGIRYTKLSTSEYLISEIKKVLLSQAKHEDDIRTEIKELSFENNSYFNLIRLRDNLKDINDRINDSEYLKNSLEITLNEYEEQLSNVIKSISVQKTD